jgi:hypothetical protein
MLVAGTSSGKIYRINVESRQQSVIAENLNRPGSMALDGSGDLLVAAEDGVQVIPRSTFDSSISGVVSPTRRLFAASTRKAIEIESPQGIAVDSCTGAVYVTTAEGTLWEYIGKNRRDVLLGDKLTEPTEIFPLYLNGQTKCQEALVLFICERQGVAIVIPSLSSGFEFVADEELPRDLEFLPGSSPFAPDGEPSIVIAEDQQISAVGVEGLYDEEDPISDEDLEYSDSEFPHLDPQGDTFEADSPAHGYRVPDIVAVDALDLEDSVLIGIIFSEVVSPLQVGGANGVDAVIDLDVDADFFTGRPSLVNEWSLLGETFLGVDAYIHIQVEAIVDVATNEKYPIEVAYVDDVVIVEIPKSLVDLSTAQLAVLVGNFEDLTDIAPNELFLDIGLLEPSYSPDHGRRLMTQDKVSKPRRIPAPPRRPRVR